MRADLDRRAFLARTGAMLAASLAPRPVLAAPPISSGVERLYRQGIIVDALGIPGGFTPNASPDSAITPGQVADVARSGVTVANCTVGPVGNGPNLLEDMVRSIGFYDREVAAHPDRFVKLLSADDILLAKRTGRTALAFGFQDTSMLGFDLTRIGMFHDLGIRIIQLTYNQRNLVGDGCLEEANGGLSRFGRDVVAELNRLSILVDLAHAGQRTIAEGIAASKAPVTISHTACRSLVDRPRNTWDRELRALAERGGVVGIYFMPFLRESGQPTMEDVIRHIDHAVQVCGEEHVGIGTDGYFSGIDIGQAYRDYNKEVYQSRVKAGYATPGEGADIFNLVPDLNAPDRLLTLAEGLHRKGYSDRRIERILGGNFQRLFSETWGSRRTRAVS